MGVLVGVCGGLRASYLPLPWVGLLLALGLALSGRAGRAIAAVAGGLLAVCLEPVPGPSLNLDRPVEVVAVVSGHPIQQRDETFFRATARIWRQRHDIAIESFDLQVTLPRGDTPPPSIGSTVRLRGYLGRSAGFANQPTIDPGPWRLYVKSQRFLELVTPPGPLMVVAGRLRCVAEEAIEEIDRMGSGGAALARALLLGDRSRLPKAWQQALQRCGLAHLLAVSGLHVGLLAWLLLVLSRLVPVKLRMLPAALGILMYLLIVGPRPSMLRAAVMGLIALATLTLQRPPQGLNALACCILVWVVHDPGIVGELGFQLSVAATAGILILLPVFNRRWILVPRVLRGPLAVTVAAQVATIPWIAPLEGGVHPLSPLLNLAAIPWLAGCLLLGFVVLLLASFVGSAAWMQTLLDVAASPIQALVEIGPVAGLFLPLGISPQSSCLLALTGISLGLWPWKTTRVVLVLGCCALSGDALSGDALSGDALSGDGVRSGPEFIVLDVGQGDATLLRDGRHAVLIDGGGWRRGDLGGRVVVPALAALGVHRLDAVLLTHPDLDHCAGLVDVARYLPVDELWMGPGWVEGRCATELLATTVRRWRVLWRGEAERVGRWHLQILHPAAGMRHSRNDRSLVVAANLGEHRLLLTGDIETSAERRLVTQYRNLDLLHEVDVLKVAHHGSKTSTSDALLREASPRIALISSGPGNRHGHPHPKVLERLRIVGARVLRTDRIGMIRLRFRSQGRISIELPAQPRRTSGK